jgi:hypothetical protein
MKATKYGGGFALPSRGSHLLPCINIPPRMPDGMMVYYGSSGMERERQGWGVSKGDHINTKKWSRGATLPITVVNFACQKN